MQQIIVNMALRFILNIILNDSVSNVRAVTLLAKVLPHSVAQEIVSILYRYAMHTEDEIITPSLTSRS